MDCDLPHQNKISLLRLNKILQERGVCSRRKADELIEAGKVLVDGKVVRELGTKVDAGSATICVENKIFPPKKREQKYYFLLNKPQGYICSNVRTKSEKLTIDLLPLSQNLRLFTVGRLDKETEGLILVTNDGDFAHRVMHPSFNVQKEYVAKVEQEIEMHHIKKIQKGITIDGARVIPQKVQKMKKTVLKVVVSEGKKHEVRKLIAHAKLNLYELKRVRIGSISLSQLSKGCFRPLTKKEIDAFLV